MASRARSAASHADASSVSGMSHANSSPPMRATRSLLRDRSLRIRPASTSTRSPTWWPWESLTRLKWSRSITASASGRPVADGAPDLRGQPLLEGAVVREAGERVGRRAPLGVGEAAEGLLVQARVRQGHAGERREAAGHEQLRRRSGGGPRASPPPARRARPPGPRRGSTRARGGAPRHPRRRRRRPSRGSPTPGPADRGPTERRVHAGAVDVLHRRAADARTGSR